MSKKLFQPTDLERIVYPSDVTISRNEQRGAWVESQSSNDRSHFTSKIYLADLPDGKISEVATPDGDNSCHPRLLCKGDKLLYLGKRSGTYQIYLRDLDSGIDQKITSTRHGVKRFSVSEDESAIAFETTLWPEEISAGIMFCEMTPDETSAWEKELDSRPYEITDIMYKRNEWFGMRKGQLQRTAVVSMAGGDQQLLNVDELETEFPALSSDGKIAYFYGYPHGGTRGRSAELFSLDREYGIRRQLTDNLNLYVVDFPLIAGDGSVLCTAVYSYEDGGIALQPYRIDAVSGEGHFVMNPKDEGVSHGVFEICTSHTAYGNWREAIVRGNDYYFLSSWHGRGNIGRKSLLHEDATEIWLPSEGHVQSFDVSDNGSVLYTQGTVDQPAEVWFRTAAGGQPIRLTNSNAWLQGYAIAKTEEFWIKSQDGKVDLQVWLTHPAHQDAGKKYPAVLDIHGGPICSVHGDFWHEVQALAGAGMAVIMTNPRGSLGYGHEFCGGNIAWKPEAMQDLLSAVDAAISKGFIDEKRIGVTGGSYGGYSTNKLIGRTNRFAAAVTQRSLVNPATSYGTGDMGYKSDSHNAQNMSMLEYLQDRLRGNLLTYVDHVKIPLLILHGYKDYRCTFEQAEQLFVAMKDRNPEVPVRMVMFPNENHDITRTGAPCNQIRHLQEMTDWFVKFIGEEKYE